MFFAHILGKRTKADPLPTPHMPQGAQAEIVYATTTRVHCDGPTFSRHPRVYLNMGNDGRIYCPYCSRQFIYQSES